MLYASILATRIERTFYEYDDKDAKVNRFVTHIHGISVDKYNTLEVFGLMHSTKRVAYMYHVQEHLAPILAFLFHGDSEEIEKKLRERCKAAGISYLTLCRAVCSVEPALLKYITVGMFCHLTPDLDAAILIATKYPSKCRYLYNTFTFDLTDKNMTAAERFSQLLLYRVAAVTDYILSEILKAFKTWASSPDDVDDDYNYSSKGYSNIVINTSKQKCLPAISITLEGSSVISCSPCSCSCNALMIGAV